MNVADLKIVVTGAASGLGRCFALELSKMGAMVMACDIDADGLDALKADDERIHTHVTDVSSEADVIATIEATVEAFGTVNSVINNAGIFRDSLLVAPDPKTGEIRKMSLRQWQQVIDIDLTGPFLFARELSAKMLELKEDGGVIINISSVSRHGNRGQSNYSAAKAGLVADTKLWAEELARYNIRVGCVAPGFVETPILEAMKPELLDKMMKAVPLRRAGKPEEIFAAVKFIIECDYFTGRCIDVDGGIRI